MDIVEYRRRSSILEKGEIVWQALPDRMEVYDERGTLQQVIPYEKVLKVRLAFAPGRLQSERFLMELSGTRSQVILSNMHFRAISDFETRNETFLPLVRAVVRGVAEANPNADFRAGERPALYWLMLVFVLAVFSLLALILFGLPLGDGNFSVTVILKLGIILISLPLLFSWAIKARPRRFDPETGLDAVISAR
jgi:hypothetical protein